jgi:hypothetical protein
LALARAFPSGRVSINHRLMMERTS